MTNASDPDAGQMQSAQRREQRREGGPSAWDAALRLLGVRARSRQEMRERLQRRGFESDVIADVMSRLESSGLLDDTEFAQEWVRSRHEHSGRGRIALKQELVAKGIEPATISAVLTEIDADAERAIAAEMVVKKLRRVDLDPSDRAERDKLFRRLVAMLARRGYPQAMAVDVVGEALAAEAGHQG